LPSIVHYLVLDPEERELIWYRRATSGGLQPPVTVDEGVLELDPPGIALAVADIFPPERAGPDRQSSVPTSHHARVAIVGCATRGCTDHRRTGGAAPACDQSMSLPHCARMLLAPLHLRDEEREPWRGSKSPAPSWRWTAMR